MRTAHAMICLSKYNNVALYYEKRLWGITVLLMPRGGSGDQFSCVCALFDDHRKYFIGNFIYLLVTAQV